MKRFSEFVSESADTNEFASHYQAHRQLASALDSISKHMKSEEKWHQGSSDRIKLQAPHLKKLQQAIDAAHAKYITATNYRK